MPSLVRALRDPKRWLAVWNWIGMPLISLVFQVFFLIFLLGFGGFTLLLWSYPRLFWGIPSGMPTGWKLMMIRSYFLAFGALYAIVWCGYWQILCALNSGNKIPAFPVHVLAAWLPLLGTLYFADPVSYPDAMIPISAAQITFEMSTAMTAAALFPFYSASIFLFVLSPSVRTGWKIGRLLGLWIIFAAVSLYLLSVFWHIAPSIYKGIAGFPIR
ncbi:hypothetical protein SAMN04487895_10248 [Paenibacillus sophorae]|uniref:Yip1 domain-containing protein n=1 Tax=Paenibacillus sophorae TaxID=1333845 RepID=A0A1H8I2M0_9BACL|nr:hypothetical protein [Paenibacillus sophorae]QWU15831.1 hypothetical protein KP014_00635 [Paenibacillus sophorae]SEN62594.1 hypothetical protein SAMN04487895_10248 [Paenibacillus sophorae]